MTCFVNLAGGAAGFLDIKLDLLFEGFEGFESLFVSYLSLKYNFYIPAIDISVKIKYVYFYDTTRTYIQYAMIKFFLQDYIHAVDPARRD